MRWRSLILPFAVVLFAVAVVFAMVASTETQLDESPYTAAAFDVDVEIAPALTGEAEIQQFAERTAYSAMYGDDQATRTVGARCICPQCRSAVAQIRYDNVLYEHESARGTYKARIGGRGVGVHAVPVLKGMGVDKCDQLVVQQADAASSSAARPQLDV